MFPISQIEKQPAETITIHVNPITKTGPIPPELVPQETDQGVKEMEIPNIEDDAYPPEYLELFLGSLAGYILQGKTTAMEKFVQYLNILAPELGSLIRQKFQNLREEFEKYFGASEIFWFNEISFSPNRSQVEFISAFSKSKILRAIASENGYTDPEIFIRDLLFNEEEQSSRTVTINRQTITLAELLSETNNKLKSIGKALKTLKNLENKKPVQNQQGTEEITSDQQSPKETTSLKKDLFSKFLKYIVSYYYFNFTGMVKPDEPPLLNERIIATTSARVDLLGFQVVNEDDEEAKNLLQEIQTKRVLNHLLLDFNRFIGSEDEKLIFELLYLIVTRRIKIILIEIKSYFKLELLALLKTKIRSTSLNNIPSTKKDFFQSLRNQRDQKPRIPPKISGLSPEESRDISHSLLAMFQFFARLTTRQSENEIFEFEKLKKLMSSEVSDRIPAIWTIIKLINNCMEQYLLRINWPIVEQNSKNSNNQKYLNFARIRGTNPDWQIIQIKSIRQLEVITSVLARARNMFEEINFPEK